MDRPARGAAARRLGVTLTDEQWSALERYVELLGRWNARFNLVSRRDLHRLWPRHILDSLSLAPVLAAVSPREPDGRTKALDAGTGAGLPGLPLAVADPATHWVLADRNARKVRFLELVTRELGLANVTVRVMDLDRPPPAELAGWADVIVSRAMAAPDVLVERTAPLLGRAGVFVLMTGATPARREPAGREPAKGVTERLLTETGFHVSDVLAMRVPGLDRVHEVTIIRRDDGSGAG